MPGLGRTYYVELLGRFAIMNRGRRLDLGAAGERLVAILASRDRDIPRARVAGLLWPDCPESRALANLRSTLHRVSSRARGLFVGSPNRLCLNAGVGVDLTVAKNAAQRLLDGTLDEEDLSASVVAMLSEDVLPDWNEYEWLVTEREAFRQVRMHALEVACLSLANLGRFGDAVGAGLAAIRAEPLRESAHRVLISAHLQEANYAEAISQYERCCALLRDELGVDPSPGLRGMMADFVEDLRIDGRPYIPERQSPNGDPRAAWQCAPWLLDEHSPRRQ